MLHYSYSVIVAGLAGYTNNMAMGAGLLSRAALRMRGVAIFPVRAFDV